MILSPLGCFILGVIVGICVPFIWMIIYAFTHAEIIKNDKEDKD